LITLGLAVAEPRVLFIMKGVFIMKNGIIFVSYTLAAMSGICFITGLAVLSSGRKVAYGRV
jgi:hypothetical protein